MRYVTFDEDGNLTGYYEQDMQPDHEDCHIETVAPMVNIWPNYRANENRDGLEEVV